MRADKDREKAKAKDQVARLVAIAAGDAKAWVEELARVQDTLAAVEEARRKAKAEAEAEAALLEVEQTSFLLDIKAAKDEVSSLQSQEDKDKEAMEKDYQKPLDLIFAYGYGCCTFKHNIYGDQLEILDGMLDSSDPLTLEFFMNPRCPPARVPTEAITTQAEQSKTAKMTKEPEKSAPAKDFAGTS